jgi:hypothetical protein
MSSFRRRMETRTGPLVVMLGRLPRFVPFLVVLGLLVGGLLAKGTLGAVLLGVLAALMAMLLVHAWPALQPQARVLRVGVTALVAVRALTFVL